MSEALPQPADCCNPCDEPTVINTPGPKGDTGTAGEDGTNGVTAYSITTSSFVQPAVNGTVTVPVSNSSWMVPTQTVYVQNGGYYEVQSRPDNASVVLKNWGYDGNTAPTLVVAQFNLVGPAGLKGADGAGGFVPGDYVLKAGSTMTGPLVYTKLIPGITALVYAASVDLDFDETDFQTLSLTGNVTFTTSNLAAGRTVTLKILSDASIRTFTFPAWIFVGTAAPASIAASKTAILSLTAFGATDASTVAAYAEQP